MEKKENTTLKGIIHLTHKRGGEIINEEIIENTITNVGIGQVSGLINGQVSQTFKYLALGTSSTAASAGDTGLASEITGPTSLDRVLANTITQTTDTVTNDTAELTSTFTNNSSSTISVQEAGIFDSSTEAGGNMLGRESFAVKNMENSDTLSLSYKIIVS